MKLTPLPLLLACLGLSALQPASAQVTPLSGASDVRSTFMVKQGLRGLFLEDVGEDTILRFEVHGTETGLLIYGTERHMQDVSLESVSVDFLIKGRGSIGFYLRGDDTLPEKGAYLALVNVAGKNRGRIRLFKHSIWPLEHPDNDLIANQDLTNISPENWYRLEFSANNTGDGAAVLKAVVTNLQNGSTVAEMEMDDVTNLLPEAGQFALRIYSEKGSDGHIELKNLTLNER